MFEHLKLTVGVGATVLFGLVADVVGQTPPAVTWAAVALSVIGFATLAVRLHYGYRMAQLDSDRLKGENRALRAENETLRAGRRTNVASEN